MFDPGSPLRNFIFWPRRPRVYRRVSGKGGYFARGLGVKIKLDESEKGRRGGARWFDNCTHCTLHSATEMCGLFRTKPSFLSERSRPQVSGVLFWKSGKASPC